jgi:glycosyltransferase involved in cell wall biosynthesis
MRLTLIAPTSLPSRRANTIQVMKMADAIAGLGHEIVVLVPRTGAIHESPAPSSWNDLARHYGLAHEFPIHWLATHPRLRSYDFGWQAVRWAKKWGADLIYSRHPQAAAFASLTGTPTILEIHDLPRGAAGTRLFRAFIRGRGARKLVVITNALANDLRSHYRRSKIEDQVLPDGVDLARYRNLPPSGKARTALPVPGLQPPVFTAGYTGHLYPGRGADLILQLARRLPDIQFLLAGGDPEDVERLQAQITNYQLPISNLHLLGFLPNADLPRYQAACDVLLMPYQASVAASSGGDIARYLSPMKVFEYLACGRVILSSDLPVLREILNERNALLLPPADVDAWVRAIEAVRADAGKYAEIANTAKKDAEQYSWEARARKVLELPPAAQMSLRAGFWRSNLPGTDGDQRSTRFPRRQKAKSAARNDANKRDTG